MRIENTLTSAQLAAANLAVPLGVLMVEADTGKAKMSVGVPKRWNDLLYWDPAAGQSATFEDLVVTDDLTVGDDVAVTGDAVVSGNLTVTGIAGSVAALVAQGIFAHQGTTLGFYNTSPIAKQTGVAVTAGGIHAALVALGLIAA